MRNMSSSKSFETTKFLTGLRGYAALAVFMVHSSLVLNGTNPTISNILNFGKYGVVVFFVLSAFTIYMSISRSQDFAFKKYTIRRFFRIYPLYLIMIVAGTLVGGIAFYNNLFDVNTGIASLLNHLSFANLINLPYRNNVLGVEWTITVEVFFYILIPIIWLILKKDKRLLLPLSVIFTGITLIPIIILPYYAGQENANNFTLWMVEIYFLTYLIGIILYIIWEKTKNVKWNNTYLIIWLCLLFLYQVVIPHEYITNVIMVSLWTAGLILILRSRTKLMRTLFENKAIEHIGLISYSFYLIHFMVLGYVSQYDKGISALLLSLLATIVISSITYRLIEIPFQNLGKRISQ